MRVNSFLSKKLIIFLNGSKKLIERFNMKGGYNDDKINSFLVKFYFSFQLKNWKKKLLLLRGN